MIEKVFLKLPLGLVNHLGGPSSPNEEWIRENWRSLTCQTCGVCCHSSLIPISDEDFDLLYEKLELNITKEEFAKKFLQNPETNSAVYTLEVEHYGGRCLFLAKRGAYYCSIWDRRASVCSDFFCWPMSNFELYENEKEQEMFQKDAEWTDNFAHLLDIVVPEALGGLFEDDRKGYSRNSQSDIGESYFSSHKDEF